MKKIFISLCLIGTIAGTSTFAYKLGNSRSAEVEQRLGLSIFYKSQRPVDEYEHLGVIELKTVSSYAPSAVIPKLLKKIKEKYPDADGVLITEEDNWQGEAIKFKK